MEKDPFLKSLVTNKSVVHVGFWGLTTDTGRREAFEQAWMHSQLAETAATLVGLDADHAGVAEARGRGFTAYAVDCQDVEAVKALDLRADIIIAGELIEHLESPGQFLEAMHVLGDTLVVTTPNANSMVNFALAMSNREAINPDHVALYSWYTLTNLLRRAGWDTEQFYVYNYQRLPLKLSRQVSVVKVASWLFTSAQRRVARLSPFLNHGLIAVARSRT